MDVDWAIEELRTYVSVHDRFRGASYPESDRRILEQEQPVIEQILDRVDPAWAREAQEWGRSQMSMASDFSPIVRSATRAITLLERQAELKDKLGPSGPQMSTQSMHPTIWDAAAHLFDGGHHRQAVQTAGQALESHLQTVAGPALSGQDLAKLFAEKGDGVRLHFPNLDPAGDSYGSARSGAAALIRGSMMAVRNLVSHPEWPDPDETEALEMLAVLSYVAHLTDRAVPIEAD